MIKIVSNAVNVCVLTVAFARGPLCGAIETWQQQMQCWMWSPAKSYAGYLEEAFAEPAGTDNATEIWEHRAGIHGFQCPSYPCVDHESLRIDVYMQGK